MSLQVQISVPGIIAVAYPLQGQTISSYVRLNGTVAIPNPGHLPAGEDYIKGQIDPLLWAQVTQSMQLKGKKYIIRDITYYMDGNAVRQVNYQEDEISSYRFNDDYIGIVYGDQISAGRHKFTIVMTAVSDQNPGIEIYDTLDIDFNFDDTSTSVQTYLDKVAPQVFLGEVDHQIVLRMLDYVLTQRTEGALKTDIDFLANLYDLDLVPRSFIPFMAKTVGYDYFAGLLGNDDTIREELRFLPDWQKSVGTKESILVLLRALSLEGRITPLYLDLNNNILVPGVKRRYVYSDTIKVVSQTKRARFTFPLTQKTFVPSTISLSITTPDNTVVASLSWDIVQNAAVWQSFLATGWLVKQDGSPATQADVLSIYADNARGGITITFNGPMKAMQTLKILVDYQYEFEGRPRRNTRLSEFFDVDISSLVKPNDFKAKDYDHVMDIIKRSKPLRTKMRTITFPVKSADAYMVNADTVSDNRLDQYNISNQAVQINNPITESVVLTTSGLFSDGFLFSWEKDCNLFENRFGIYHSLALEPSYFGEEFRQILANDTLVQRGHAIIVNDDRVQGNDRVRYLRRVGFQLFNFTTEPACYEGTDKLTHFQTIKHDAPVSPAVQTYHDRIIGLDAPVIDGSNPVSLFLDVLDQVPFGQRAGFVATWDGASGLVHTDLATNAPTVIFWDTNLSNLKIKTFTESFGTAVLTLYRPVVQADVENLYVARPNLRNITLVLNQWYAIWDLQADFNATPIHLSIQFAVVNMNHQGDCCCGDLGMVTTSTPLSFNTILGKVYQFGWEFDFEIYDLATQEVVAVYHWSSAYWTPIRTNGDIAVSLSPVNSGSWTDDLRLQGTVTYTGAIPSGIASEWGCRACPKKVGDNMVLNLSTTFEDDFGLAQTHRGMFGAIDDLTPFLGVPIRSLVDHEHNQGNQRMAAYDGIYLRNNTVAACFVWTITFPAVSPFNWDSGARWDDPNVFTDAQMTWDSGDTWDDDVEWDTPGIGGTSLRIHHFPKKLVFQNFTPGNDPFLYIAGDEILLLGGDNLLLI